MSNGIGEVWAANFGDDSKKPNGVGEVWIANADAFSGGVDPSQINELSAAIDYVSANAGDPNALTGYQTDGGELSSTSSEFVARADNAYDFVLKNKALLSADGYNGLLYSADEGFILANIDNNDADLVLSSKALGLISAHPFGIAFEHTGAHYSGAFRYDGLTAKYNNLFDYCIKPEVFSAQSQGGNYKIVIDPRRLTLTDHPGGSAFLSQNCVSGQPTDNVRYVLGYNGVSGEAFGGTTLWQLNPNGLQIGATTAYPNVTINRNTNKLQFNNTGTAPSANYGSDTFNLAYPAYGNSISATVVDSPDIRITANSANTGASAVYSFTAMANKINQLEQILQTYSGQWLLNASDNA